MLQNLTHTFLAVGAQGLQACSGVEALGGNCASDGASFMKSFGLIANTLIFLIGAIAVLMVIIGALRYVLSNGDSAGLKSAKDTILYALVGVVVAMLAYALVAFVSGRFA